MAQCDECGCYNDDHFDGTVTEEEFDNNPLYEPNRYYYCTGISKKIIKCQRDIGAYAKIALCNYQLLKSLSMELTNLILNGMMKKWAGLCHLNKCPLSVAILFKISYIKNVESRDSEEGEAGRPKGSPPIVATYSHS